MEQVTVDLAAVVMAVTDEQPHLLTVIQHDGVSALPAGPLDTVIDATLERAMRRWVLDQTGVEVGFVEQFHTFGDKNRDPRSRIDGSRFVTVAYLSLADEGPVAETAAWADWYELFPWEDHREGPPAVIRTDIGPFLTSWADATASDAERTARRARAQLAFGLWGSAWDNVRVAERFDLLYEVGFVEEAHRDGVAQAGLQAVDSQTLALDHRRIAAAALGRLRTTLQRRPVVFELAAEDFTLRELQNLVEALAGEKLHTQSFRRLVDKGGLVEGTGEQVQTGGRPAELFRYRREVVAERPRPGAGPFG